MAHEALQLGTSLNEGLAVTTQSPPEAVPFDSRTADTIPYELGQSPEEPRAMYGPIGDDTARPFIEGLFAQVAALSYQTTDPEVRIAQRKHLREQVAAHYGDGQLRLPRDRDAANPQEIVVNYVERELETRIGKIARTRIRRKTTRELIERSQVVTRAALDSSASLLASTKENEALLGLNAKANESIALAQERIAAARAELEEVLSTERLADYDATMRGDKKSETTPTTADTDKEFGEIVDRDDLGPAPHSGGVPTVPMDLQSAA